MSGRQDMLKKEYEERRAKYVPEGEEKKQDKGSGENGGRWTLAVLLVVGIIVAVAWWLWR